MCLTPRLSVAAAVAVCVSLSFCSSLARASVTLSSPANGASVQLQQDGHKTYFAKSPRATRWTYMDSNDGRKAMIAVTSRPKAVRLAWSGGTAPYTVTVCRAHDNALFVSQSTSAAYLDLYNFEIGRKYTWQVTDKNGSASASRTFTTEPDAPRFLRVGVSNTVNFTNGLERSSGKASVKANGPDFLPNFRDVGGVYTADGTKRMKQGLVYRSYEFCKYGSAYLPFGVDTDVVCGQLGVKTDLDLRSTNEVASIVNAHNSKSPLNASAHPVEWIHCPIAKYDAELIGTHEKNALALFASTAKLPLVFHCMCGQDRTGCLALYLYAILGVDDETMVKSWEASSFFQGDNNQSPSDPGFRSYRIQGFIDSFRAYGTESDSLATCVVKALKAKNVVTDATIANIRATLLETDPDTPTSDKKGFERAREEGRPPRVLVIGNSFTQGVSRDVQYKSDGTTVKETRTHFPTAVRAMGEQIDYCALYRGGSTIQQHYEGRATRGFFAEIDWSFDSAAPSWATAKKGMLWLDEDGKTKDNRLSETLQGATAAERAKTPADTSLEDILAAVDWDVVMIQEASVVAPFFNKGTNEWTGVHTPEPFRDYETGTARISYGDPLKNYVAYLKAKAPHAELWWHQTWALHPETTCIDLGTDAKRDWMYNALNTNAEWVAQTYGAKIMPTGYAVQLYRYQLPVTQRAQDPCSYDTRHINGGYYVYGTTSIPAEQRYRTYLQMMTWCQRFYGKMPAAGATAYEPSVADEKTLMRSCALQAANATSYRDYGQEEPGPPSEDSSWRDAPFDADHTIVCYGDSLTYGRNATPTPESVTVGTMNNYFDGRLNGQSGVAKSYPYYLSQRVPSTYNVIAQARTGMYADMILSWQGGTTIKTARAFTLPKSGTVNVATNFLFNGTGRGRIAYNDNMFAQYGGMLPPYYALHETKAEMGTTRIRDGITGKFGNIRVRITGDRATNLTVKAVSALSANTTIPAGTTFVPDSQKTPYKDAIQVIFVGTNDGTNNYQTYIAEIRTAVANIPSGRYVVVSSHREMTMPGETDSQAATNTIEKAFAAAFGNHHLNLRLALYAKDANWETDGKLDTDNLHFTAAGYDLVSEIVYDKLNALGYLGGVKPVDPPDPPTPTSPISLTSPADGSTLALYTANQKKFFALTYPAIKTQYTGFDPSMTNKYLRVKPTFTWSGASGAVTVTVARKSDGAVLQTSSLASGTKSCAVANLDVGTEYVWTVTDAQGNAASATFTTEGQAPRIIYSAKVPSVRDLGGWVGLQGCRVRSGQMFRTAEMHNKDSTNRLSAAERDVYRNVLGIRTEVDFRSVSEVTGVAAASPIGGSVAYVRYPIMPYALGTFDPGEDKPYGYMRLSFDKAFDPATRPMIFHCKIGRDRTGTFAALTFALLGVCEDDIYREYRLAGDFPTAASFRIDELIALLKDTYPAATLAASAKRYFTEALGYTAAEVEQFRSEMLVGYVKQSDPEDPTHYGEPDTAAATYTWNGASGPWAHTTNWTASAGATYGIPDNAAYATAVFPASETAAFACTLAQPASAFVVDGLSPNGTLVLDNATLTVAGPAKTGYRAFRLGDAATGAASAVLRGANAGLVVSRSSAYGSFGSESAASATGTMTVRFEVPATPWTVAPVRATAGDSKIRFYGNVRFEVDATAVSVPSEGKTVRIPLAVGTAVADGTGAPEGVVFANTTFDAVKARSVVTPATGAAAELVYENAALYLDVTAAETPEPPAKTVYYFVGSDEAGKSSFAGSAAGAVSGWATNGTVLAHTVAAGNNYVVPSDHTLRTTASSKDFKGDALTLAGTILLKGKPLTLGFPSLVAVGGSLMAGDKDQSVTLNGAITIPEGQSLTFSMLRSDSTAATVTTVAAKLTGAGTLTVSGATVENVSAVAQTLVLADAGCFTGTVVAATLKHPQNFVLKVTGGFGGAVASLPEGTTKVVFKHAGLDAAKGVVVSSATVPAGLATGLVLYGVANPAAADLPLMTFPAGTVLDPTAFTVKYAATADGAATAFANLGVIANADGTKTLAANVTAADVTVDGEKVTFDADFASKVNTQKTVVFSREPTISGTTVTLGGTSATLPAYYDVAKVAADGGWRLVLTLNETARPVVAEDEEGGQKAVAVGTDAVTVHVGNRQSGLFYALGSADEPNPSGWDEGAYVPNADPTAPRAAGEAKKFYKVFVRDWN